MEEKLVSKSPSDKITSIPGIDDLEMQAIIGLFMERTLLPEDTSQQAVDYIFRIYLGGVSAGMEIVSVKFQGIQKAVEASAPPVSP